MAEQSSQSQHRRRHRSNGDSAWLSNSAIALLPVLACFLGGGTQKWAEGIVIALLGLFLLARPPRISLGRAINGLFLVLIVLAAIAFLPSAWFFVPPWRTTLTNEFKIPLPPTVSPQPWITATCLISLIAGMSWLYLVSTQDVDLRAVR